VERARLWPRVQGRSPRHVHRRVEGDRGLRDRAWASPRRRRLDWPRERERAAGAGGSQHVAERRRRGADRGVQEPRALRSPLLRRGEEPSRFVRPRPSLYFILR